MAELTPLFMDISNVYSGDDLGLPWRDVIGEGVVGAGALAVTQRASGADLSVDVAPGAAWVTGDTNTDAQPTYRIRNDATVNLGINPDPSNPRKVLIVAQITDETFAGVGRQWQLQAIHGTPGATPADPALPASALKLADLTVPAGATSIVTADIADSRVRAKVGGGTVLASGAELFYDEATAPVTITGTGENNATTLLDTGSQEYDGTPIIFEAWGSLSWGVGYAVAAGITLCLFDGGAAKGQFLGLEAPENSFSWEDSFYVRRRIVPTIGSHQYKLSAFSSAPAAKMNAGAGGPGAWMPSAVRITKA